jgi:YspA, cpYpsA-related SLOG family
MRVLVCGGRDFMDLTWLFRELDAIHSSRNVTTIISGCARGPIALASSGPKPERSMLLSSLPTGTHMVAPLGPSEISRCSMRVSPTWWSHSRAAAVPLTWSVSRGQRVLK